MRDFNKLAKNSKIYVIKSKNCSDVYIGCTSELTLSRRLSKHVYDFKRYNDTSPIVRSYCSSFQILANGDYSIECLEDCCDIQTREELFKKEQHYINILPCVNKVGNKNISL